MRTGATARIRSVYLRDPDLNLIELSELAPRASASGRSSFSTRARCRGA